MTKLYFNYKGEKKSFNLIEQSDLDKLITTINTLAKRLEDLENSNTDPRSEQIKVELQWLKDNKLSAEEIADRYFKVSTSKNNFSNKELYLHLGGTGNPSEKIMSEFTYKKLHG